MFLFKKGLSLIIRRLSSIPNRIFLFSLVSKPKLSKDGEWLQSNKWSLTSLPLGLNFFLVRFRYVLQFWELRCLTYSTEIVWQNSTTEKTRKSLKPIGTRPGVMHDSYKVHKTCVDNCPPFGLFLSTLNTPTYKLANFLVPNLKPLTTNEFTV